MSRSLLLAPPSASSVLSGAPASPYTRKMLAVLRYRRIAYRLLLAGSAVPGLPQAKPPLKEADLIKP